MKGLADLLNDALSVLLRWRSRKHLIVVAFVWLVPIAGWIWMVCSGDDTSFLMLAAVVGVVRGDSLIEKLYASPEDAELTTTSPVHALMAHWKSIFRLGMSVLHAKGAHVAIWDRWTGDRLDWRVQRTGKLMVEVTTAGEPWVMESLRKVSSAFYVRKSNGIASWGVDRDGKPLASAELPTCPGVFEQRSFKTLMVSELDTGPRWHGRVLYMDAPASIGRRRGMSTLKDIVDVAVAGANVFEIADSLARADERRCLARDLHDGVTQSLIATELQIALLEREKAAAGKRKDGATGTVWETLRRETRRLRGQIEELQRGEQPDSVRRMMERVLSEFAAETGIAAELACGMEGVKVSPRLGFELLCLLREAISNVRKHSGATRVDVRFHVGNRAHLQIEDNGCGLGFTGHYELSELAAFQNKPRSICERVQANGGCLTLESSMGGGVRLEIELPLCPASRLKETELEITPESGSRKPPGSAGPISSMQRAS
ncbi:MAG: sensor histidine kinase [Acidobacteriaceae bacterium]